MVREGKEEEEEGERPRCGAKEGWNFRESIIPGVFPSMLGRTFKSKRVVPDNDDYDDDDDNDNDEEDEEARSTLFSLSLYPSSFSISLFSS